jgi:hypothetical protein
MRGKVAFLALGKTSAPPALPHLNHRHHLHLEPDRH